MTWWVGLVEYSGQESSKPSFCETLYVASSVVILVMSVLAHKSFVTSDRYTGELEDSFLGGCYSKKADH